MPNETCESKVANLLASLDKIPEDDWDAKLRVLILIVEAQELEIAELKKILEDNGLWEWNE